MKRVEQYDDTVSLLADRLREMPLTEAERASALLQLQRGERFADLVLAGTRAIRELIHAARRSFGVAARHARVAIRRASRGKPLLRRHRTPRVHSH